MPSNVRVRSTLDFAPTKNDVVVMDEGENHIFATPSRFRKLARSAKYVVVLTAIVADSSASIEAKLIKDMNIRVYKHDAGHHNAPTFETIKWAKFTQEEKFQFVKELQR